MFIFVLYLKESTERNEYQADDYYKYERMNESEVNAADKKKYCDCR